MGRLPLSKSIAARALVLGALADEPVGDEYLSDCDDIAVMRRALTTPYTDEINVGDSATALRFLTAFFASRPGVEVTITGSDRLCERPLQPLVDALRSLGASIDYAGKEGHAPVIVKGKALSGGEVDLKGVAQSSQYASALALIAPTLSDGLRINLGGQIASTPYLKMTLAMLRVRGVNAEIEGYTVMVAPGKLQPVGVESEPDWSAAAFWYAIAAVSAGWVTLPSLTPDSIQGDSILKTLGERFGVVTEFTDAGAELSATPDIFSRLDMDMSDYPDLVPPLAIVAALTGLPFVFSGIGHLRHKESDRLKTMVDELRKIGIVAEAGTDTLSWEGERIPVMRMPQIDANGDHRIAMAFAVASFVFPGIVIDDPSVVGKSYPGFFDDLKDAGFTICGPDDPIPAEFCSEE